MRKILRGIKGGCVFALAVALLWIPIAAKADHTAIIGSTFTATGSSSTLSTRARGTRVYAFFSGTYDMVVDLQREAGSKGSGAFEVIQRDIFPDVCYLPPELMREITCLCRVLVS